MGLGLYRWLTVADPGKNIRGGALNLRFSPFVGGGGCGRDTSCKGAPDLSFQNLEFDFQ